MSLWEEMEVDLGLAAGPSRSLGQRLEARTGVPTDALKKFGILALLQALLAIAFMMSMPLAVFAQAQYFNSNRGCIGRMGTDDCSAAMSRVASVQTLTQLVQATASFLLAPVAGRMSDAFGRRGVTILALIPPAIFMPGSLFVWAITGGRTGMLQYYISFSFPFMILFTVLNAVVADVIPSAQRAAFFSFREA